MAQLVVKATKCTRLESFRPAIVESSLACKGKRFKPSIDRKVVKFRVFASEAKSAHSTIPEETKPEANVKAFVLSMVDTSDSSTL